MGDFGGCSLDWGYLPDRREVATGGFAFRRAGKSCREASLLRVVSSGSFFYLGGFWGKCGGDSGITRCLRWFVLLPDRLPTLNLDDIGLAPLRPKDTAIPDTDINKARMGKIFFHKIRLDSTPRHHIVYFRAGC